MLSIYAARVNEIIDPGLFRVVTDITVLFPLDNDEQEVLNGLVAVNSGNEEFVISQ